jgi:hypothetical protein
MRTRLVPILLWTLGLLAFAGSSFVLYNFVVNDWRLEGDILSPESLRSFLGGKKPNDDSTRLVSSSFALEDSAAVTIDAALCRISIVPSTSPLSEVHLFLSGDAIDTALFGASVASSDSGNLLIAARPTSRWTEEAKGLVEIDLSIPAGSRITIRLRTGELRIDRMGGEIRVEMGDGKFEATGLKGTLALRNSNGSVRLERCEATGSVELGSGTVEMLFNDGDLHVSAPDGINARSHFGGLEATTIGGSITAELLGSRPSCRLRSESGPIFLTILPGSHASISARTELGILSSSLRLDIPDSVARKTPSFLVAPFNGGGDSIVIESRSGTLILDELGDQSMEPPPFELNLDTTGPIPDSLRRIDSAGLE